MLKFYRTLQTRLASRPRPAADPTRTFTPRDWADLPPYHPLRERE
jgi:hypothetical protein